MRFFSDNAARVCPEAMAALAAANEPDNAYDGDALSARLDDAFSELFGAPVAALWVASGTAANALALAAMVQGHQAVICHEEAHIQGDECGSPEFYTGGAKLMLARGPGAKLAPTDVAAFADSIRADVHQTQPAALSITNATEYGLVYAPHEVAALGALAATRGWGLHMDGARFANALVALDATPAQLTWQAGVDALSFGATKNGVLAAEAIVLFDRSLDSEMAYRRKRAGHLLSKMRLLSVQMNAYLENDLWLANARHANAMARRLEAGLATIGPIRLHAPVEANMLFCSLPAALGDGLVEQGFGFYRERWGPGSARLVTSFATTADDVDGFVEAARRLAAG